MLIMSLLCAALETSLNTFLFKDAFVQPIQKRLVGKTLQIELKELPAPLTLFFFAQRIDVVSEWSEPDCTLKTSLAILACLRNRQQLTQLLQKGTLNVEGDIQVVQLWMRVFDEIEWDFAEWISPYIGDVATEALSRFWQKSHLTLRQQWQRDHLYLSEVLTEEWCLAPGNLEVIHFNDQVDVLASSVEELDTRLSRMEFST